MGQLAARFGDHAGESSKIPILREKLPDEMKSKLEHATGFSCLGLSLWGAKRIGYSYQTIMTINRIPMSQI